MTEEIIPPTSVDIEKGKPPVTGENLDGPSSSEKNSEGKPSEIEKFDNQLELTDLTQIETTEQYRKFIQDELNRGVNQFYLQKVAIVNRALSEIGFGRYQLHLFLLCGFGWFCDQLWLQTIAIILPEIERSFNRVGDGPFITLALTAGLVVGATFWSLGSDVMGRRVAFNATLFCCGIFGIAAGGSNSFVTLGGLASMIGAGLGGNLPVDSAIFLEFLPQKNQNLLTLLSINWALGQLVASLVGWGFIVNYTCDSLPIEECTKANNMGWRYTLYTLGGLTLIGFCFRFFVFKMRESPKFLISQGEDEKAIDVLHQIAAYNGKTITLSVEEFEEIGRINTATNSVVSSRLSIKDRIVHNLGKFKFTHIKALFSNKKMAFSTTMIICIWTLIGLAYPLYTSFLPLYLKQKTANLGVESTNTTYRNYVIVCATSVAGSLMAAFMVELRIGRKGGMCISGIVLGVFLCLFTTAKNNAGVIGYNCAAGILQQMLYGILYAYTPETFPAAHRGTGAGLAAAGNRIAAMMAPVIKLYSPTSSIDVPIFISASLFIVIGFIVLLLPFESRGHASI